MCNKVVRQIMKRSSTAGVVPTIPPSDDHTDGSWISTDIYKGELFWNEADGILYSRSNDGIITLAGGYTGQVLEYEAIITQSGASDPVAYVYKNTIGAIVWSRFAKGKFRATLTGAFPQYRTGVRVGQDMAEITKAFRSSTDYIEIRTADSTATLQDGIMSEVYVLIKVFPEIPAS